MTLFPKASDIRLISLSREEEHSLLQHIEPLPFREFEFQGFTGKRRIVSYGWRYDFNGGGLTKRRICRVSFRHSCAGGKLRRYRARRASAGSHYRIHARRRDRLA